MAVPLKQFATCAGVEPLYLGEDTSFHFLFKPPGLPVFPPHEGEGPSVLAWWLRRSPSAIAWPTGFEGGICHRLDTSTSGLVLVSRDLAELEGARARFGQREFRKRYLFLTAGSVAWIQNHVTAEVGHHPDNRRKMVVRRGHHTPHRGKWYEASTEFDRVEIWPGGISLWQATITTGVMHQIRVHAAWVGLALLGDGLYGGEKAPGPTATAPFWLHHLSSSSEGWSSPEAPLPEVWQRVSSTPRDLDSQA